MAFFPLERKRRGCPEPLKSRRHTSAVLHSGCVGVQCPQAACVGCAAELGASHPGPPASHSLTHSHPCSPQPIQKLAWLIHTHNSSLHGVTVLRQRRNVYGWVSSLVITTLTNVSLLSMCSRTPSEWFDRVWFSSFSGSCLPCSSCCPTALTKSCSEFSLGMQHHSLSALGCWSSPAHLKWFVIW